MRTISLLLIIACATISADASSYLAVETTVGWRFVDHSGHYRKGVYEEAGTSSGGFVPVRQNGFWGYMDNSITWRISAKYDVVSSFQGHFAVVGKDKHFFLINNKGEKISSALNHSIPLLSNFRSAVWKDGDEYGILENNGSWTVEPEYSSIDYDEAGVFLLHQRDEVRQIEQYRILTPEYILMDLDTGIRFARFIGHGYIMTIRADANNTPWMEIYSKTGNRAFVKRFDNEDLAGVRSIGNERFFIPKDENAGSYDEFLDGNFIYANDTVPVKAFRGLLLDENFSETGLAILRNRYVFIDHFGRIKSDYLFREIVNTPGHNHFLTRINGKWMLANRFSTDFKPLHEDLSSIHPGSLYRDVFLGETSEEPGWVLMNFKGHVLNNDRFDHVIDNWQNGFIRLSKNNKEYIMSYRGKVVWSEDSLRGKGAAMNLSHMARSQAYAKKPFVLTKNSYLSKSVRNNRDTLLLIWGSKVDTGFYMKRKLFLVNTLKKHTVMFEAQDRRLYIIMEAETSDGTWEPIEYSPNSWCGNSYYNVELPPASYWEFLIPEYKGVIKTRMRARLTMKKESGDPYYIYSEPVPVSVNPGQFWVKRGYMPNGLMDPYLD